MKQIIDDCSLTGLRQTLAAFYLMISLGNSLLGLKNNLKRACRQKIVDITFIPYTEISKARIMVEADSMSSMVNAHV